MSTFIKQPKIAIVVPVYNIEEYVEECLKSILSQTYTNWDCFVVDDGSTDNSGEVVDRFVAVDKRFKAIHKPNGGLSAARNTALEMVEELGCYDYVAFVDGDDYICEDMYSILVKSIEKNESEIAVCGYYKFNKLEEVNFKEGIQKDSIISADDYVRLIFSSGPWSKSLLAGGMVWKNLFCRETIFGLRFSTKNIIEDELFSIQSAKNTSRISIVNQRLYGYRQRKGSLVKDNKFLMKHIEARKLCIEEAGKISKSARLVALVAYLSVVMNLFKQDNQPITLLTDYEDDFNCAKQAGFVGWKTGVLYSVFTKSPILSNMYRDYRNLFKKLFSKRELK